MQALKGSGSTASTHSQPNTRRSWVFRRHAPGALHKTKTQYQIYSRLGGPRSRLGGQKHVAPTGIIPLTRSDLLYRRIYSGHREKIVSVIRVFRPWIWEKFFIRIGKIIFGRLPVPVCAVGPVIIIGYFKQILGFSVIYFFQIFPIYFFHTCWNVVFVLSKLCCLLFLLVYNNGKSVSWSRILFANNLFWGVCLKQWYVSTSWPDVVRARGILNYLFHLISVS
jgi:hypothetical protein